MMMMLAMMLMTDDDDDWAARDGLVDDNCQKRYEIANFLEFFQIEDDNRKAHVKFRKENPIFYEQVLTDRFCIDIT